MKTFDQIYKEIVEAKQAIKWRVKPPAGTKNAHPDGKQPGKTKFSAALIKKAIAIANSPKYKDYYSGAYRAIEKLKPGLEDHPKVLAALKAANEGNELEEGTWKAPKNNKQIAPLMKLMKKPIKLGKDGEDAIDVIEPYIGDDELYDDLSDAGKKNPKGDARPIIKDALRRFGFKEEVTVDELTLKFKAKKPKKKTIQNFNNNTAAAWKKKQKSKGK